MVDRFISEKQLEEERASGIPQRKPAPAPAKPLYEQLRENREKADEEFQEKIKFRGPRTLDIDDVTYFEERERKRHERQLLTEQEDQQELAKFEIRLASQQPEDLFPVVIIKDDEEKKHKKPKLANLLAVKVQDKEGVGQKRKLSQMTGGGKDKGKEKTNQKKVVVLTPFASKKTKTNQEKGGGDKGAESNGSKQVKKTEQETATSEENEEDGEGGGGLFSLVDY